MRWVDPKAPADDPRHPGNAKVESAPPADSPAEDPPAEAPPVEEPAAPKKAPKRRAARKPADLEAALAKLNKTKGTTT